MGEKHAIRMVLEAISICVPESGETTMRQYQQHQSFLNHIESALTDPYPADVTQKE